MATSEEAAAAAAAELVGNEAGETQSGSEETESTDIEWPTFDLNLSAEMKAELEEEDDPTVDDDDLAALSEQYDDVSEDVLRRLAAAEKKAAHFEALRVKEAKKNWTEEAAKHFPLSEPFLDEIQATSRRGFLRTAKQVHERMQPLVEEKVLKPAREAIEKTKKEAEAEVKAEVKTAWGEPVKEDGSQEAPPAAQQGQQRRRRGELSDVIRGMMFNKE